MTGRYANIIIDISHENVDRPFQYRIPDELRGRLEPGACVRVPFGTGNTVRKGYVLEITDKAQYPPDKMKWILQAAEEEMKAEAESIRLAAWIKRQYGSTMIQALKTVLPVKRRYKPLEKKTVRLALGDEEAAVFLGECRRKHQTARLRLVEELVREKELPYELVLGKLNISRSTLNSLEELGVLSVASRKIYRNPVDVSVSGLEKKTLSPAQEAVAEGILADFDAGELRPSLIHGITGSGKTEVYIRLIGEMMKRGRQTIMLIPEIALTYQTVLRFYRHFGDRISVMNSTLSQGEKYDQFERARKGELDVIIGPRSALFTPFPRLGLIIIDEEHENSYKSETMPRYHAREVAEQIASMNGACVVLGSATPSLEAYYRAGQGRYRLYKLTERLAGGMLPQVYIADMREELKQGNRSIFSRQLSELLEGRLAKGEQTMLFLNRRGYAGFVSCRSCGHVIKCPHCDVSLSEHRGGRLVCHYCGYEEKEARRCPECGSGFVAGFKAGTQQIEDSLRVRFPGARVLRMDADTTRSKDSYGKILSSFAHGEADILVGTQMIVKGHDFPNVTLMGILAADLSLGINDYRAGERTFQLLTQAAGRAGRGEKPGEVVIQTYQPDNYSIVHAAGQDYEGFYEEEIAYRELLLYPPAAHMMAVLVLAACEDEGRKLAERISCLLRKMGGDEGGKRAVVGPAPASVGKINDVYRFVLYVKDREREGLVLAKESIEAYLETDRDREGPAVQFDFDPMSAY